MSGQGKHTAGPWAAKRRFDLVTDDNPGVNYFEINSGVGYFNEYVESNELLTDGVGFSLTGFMAEPDAHLIAAAPDLYVALKETAHALGLLILASGDFCVLNAKAIDAANAALAKAEGRA